MKQTKTYKAPPGLLLSLLLMLLLAACQSAGPEVPPTVTTVQEQPPSQEEQEQPESEPETEDTEETVGEDEAYPAPVTGEEGGYPAPEIVPPVYPDPNAPYPDPASEIGPPVVELNQPITASDTSVSGTGLPNLPITIVNISRNAQELGQGTIGEDGTFDIPVTGLESSTVLGVMPGDLEGSGYTTDDLVNCEGCRDLPLVGLILAQTVVE